MPGEGAGGGVMRGQRGDGERVRSVERESERSSVVRAGGLDNYGTVRTEWAW